MSNYFLGVPEVLAGRHCEPRGSMSILICRPDHMRRATDVYCRP